MPWNISLKNWFRHEVDGGWAWIVCAASFLIQFIVFGTIQSYGIIFIALLDEFKSGEYETAWIGSLAYGLQFLIGPITTTLCEHFGCRKMVFLGTGILMMGLFGSSFSPNLSTLFFTFGILWGIGASFTFFPCMLVLRFYFSERISLANGISMCGAGIGTIVINVVLNRVIQEYGWRGGLRMLGGVVTVMFACGSVYLPPPADFYAIREWSNYKKVKFTAKLSRILDVRPWKQKAFVVYVLGISLVLFGYFIPYVHLVRFGETLGVSSSQGALLVGYMSISQIFAKLCCGRLADMKTVKRLYILVMSILGFAVCNMAVTAAKDFDALLAYVVFFGFFDGLFVVVLPILICDIVGRDLMATAIGGFYGVAATPMMLGPPISGQLHDAFNSYSAAFLGAAFLMIIGGALMYVVYRLKPELVRKELQFSAELEADDMFTSNLFSCPSIHSHTVDALSGMVVSERYSMVNLDRPSQITFNPLHNLSYITKSRAGSSASRQTYFPSFATDDCSEGRSEVFLQRLRGSSTATETGSHLHGNASIDDKDDGFAASTPKVLSIDDLFVKEAPEPTIESTSPRQDTGASDTWNKDEITAQEAVTGEQAYVNEIKALEEIASTETLVNLNCQSQPQYNEVLDTVPEKGVLAESEVAAFLELNTLTDINASEDLQPRENQLQDQVDYANEEESAVGPNQGVLKVEGFQPHALPVIPEGTELPDTYHLQKEVDNKDSLLNDLSASAETPSTDLQTTDASDPTVRTATLVEISDTPLSDKLDDSDTLVPEDTDLSSDTVKYEGTEPEFEQIVAEDLHEDDALIKLPPPPNVVREMVSSPLVDLQEDRESTEEAREPDNQNILVNILEDVTDVGQEAENIQSTIYTENDINVSSYPAVGEELLSPMFVQGNTGIEFPSEAQDFHTPLTTEGVNSTHFDLLSRRLEAVAAEQMKGGIITRFPTDEMTLFAASRSMVPTPFENQGTPASNKEPCTSQQSKSTSAHRTPRDICLSATNPWQQPSHTEGHLGSNNEAPDSYASRSPADYQENKDLPGTYQENEMIKIPPPPDFERRRPSVYETQEPIIQFQDLESDLGEVCSEMDDNQKIPERDACNTFNQDPGSVEPRFHCSDVEREEEGMTTSNVISLVSKDVTSPVLVETLYDDQAVAGKESAQEFVSPVSSGDVDSVSERPEDVGNRQLQEELTTKFLTDEMTLFAETRNSYPDDAPLPIQQVNTASTDTNEISIISPTKPSEMPAQDDVQFPGSLPSNNASAMTSGISENVSLNVGVQSKLVVQHGTPLQRFDTDSDVLLSLSPANYDSSFLLNKERSTSTNPFLTQVNVPPCDKNDTSDVLLDQRHPEESSPISIPLDPERKRSSRKPLTSEDSLEYSVPSSSSSMVNIFEIEIDEDLKDRGNWTEHLAPAPDHQVAHVQSNKVDSSTNPFITEMQDGNIQTKDLQPPIVAEIVSVSKKEEMISDTKDHYDATYEITLRELPVETEMNETASAKKIRATKEDVSGEEGFQETTFNESQEGSSMDDHSKTSEFEALDKEISNQLALIKENFECYPEDVPVSNCLDEVKSGAANERNPND